MLDDQHALAVLGLSAADQALYESLIRDGPVLVPEAGDAAGVARLERLGILTRRHGDPPQWSVVPPDAALAALVSAQRRSLHEARQTVTRLVDTYHCAAGVDGTAPVEVVRGGEAVLAMYERMQHEARQEVRVFDAPPYLTDGPPQNATEFELLRRGIRHRVIYDRQAVSIPGRLPDLAASFAHGEQSRVADVPIKMILTDRPLAMLPLRCDDVQQWLLVRDEVLVATLSALFEAYWDRAVPLRVSGPQPPAGDQEAPTEIERDLLQLLVGGLTDQAIADHFGIHLRTVRRWLQALLARLDAATRFQAGYQAARRGWLDGSGDAG
jgi:DNA-binding CsgD family transcriptional regulator